MLVSELRKSLTGLDRAVKTYSFMLHEDQVPVIQVESPPVSRTSVQRVPLNSSQFSSLDSEEDLTGWEFDPYPPETDMDNFASGIINTFESNLLKLKDFQTQSLPDVFEATKRYGHDDGLSDISPLSSASVSTVSILDAVELMDPSQDSPSSSGGGAHAVYPTHVSPLALNGCSSPSPKDKARFSVGLEFGSGAAKKSPPEEIRGHRPKRVSSAGSCGTWGSSSPAGSEFSERDLSAPSPQPLAIERLRGGLGQTQQLVNGMSNGILENGMESPHHHNSPEEPSKRHSRVSVSSSKFEEPVR